MSDPRITAEQFDLIESVMGGHKNSAAAAAARAVLVDGLSRPQAQALHNASRASVANAIARRVVVLETAKKIVAGL